MILQPLCEAEPPVLADYVIALLKNEAPISEMHVTCERELLDFLQEHTKVVLRTMNFFFRKHRSYSNHT
jgi:RNA-binding protein 26